MHFLPLATLVFSAESRSSMANTREQKNREDQLRLTYSQFVTLTWQILISASHDVSVSGQFKQDFGITLRIAKLF